MVFGCVGWRGKCCCVVFDGVVFDVMCCSVEFELC